MNLQNDMSLAANPNRFSASANLMFLDLPGCGFSFDSDLHDLPSTAKSFGEQLTAALNAFIKSPLGQSESIVIAG